MSDYGEGYKDGYQEGYDDATNENKPRIERLEAAEYKLKWLAEWTASNCTVGDGGLMRADALLALADSTYEEVRDAD